MSIEIEVDIPKSGFTMIPNELLRDSELSMEARGFLAFLMSFETGWKHTRPYLEKACGFGQRKFDRVSKELREAGYLEVVPVRGEGGKMLGRKWRVNLNRNLQNVTFGDRTLHSPNIALSNVGECNYKRILDLKENQILKEDQTSPPDCSQKKSKRKVRNNDEDLVVILKTAVSEQSARDFVQYRREIDRPFSETSAKRMAIKLAKFIDPEGAIDRTIVSGKWIDVYEEEHHVQGKHRKVTDRHGDEFEQEPREPSPRMVHDLGPDKAKEKFHDYLRLRWRDELDEHERSAYRGSLENFIAGRRYRRKQSLAVR